MGGRLDSTNVCRPTLTVITNIGVDHQKQLGRTKAKIAAEKAGIIKANVPLVCGVREAGPATVIQHVADSLGIRSFWLGRDFNCRVLTNGRGRQMQFSTAGEVGGAYDWTQLRLKMFGRHQAINGSVAVAAIQWLGAHGWNVDEEAIRVGLATCAIDGRFQIFAGNPPIVLDIAHNEISTRAFLAAMLDRFGDTKRRTLLFSASKDKKIPKMMRLLFPHFRRVILTSIVNNPRGCNLGELQRMAVDVAAEADTPGTPIIDAYPDPVMAWQQATAQTADTDLIAVSGSAYLVGQMLPIVRSHLLSAQAG